MTSKEHEILRHLCGISYYDFFIEFWNEIEGEPLADNWHIKYLCDQFQEIGERVINREPLKHNLIVNISPGETKSSIATVFFPVWLWTRDPSLRIITSSYSRDLAKDHASKSRDIISSELFQALHGDLFQIRKDSDNKLEYKNDQGGARVTASVGSTITGRHAHILIVDDPLNYKQSQSTAERESANRWMTRTLPTRKVSQTVTPTCLIMQRLHEEDPTAIMAESWGKTGKLKWIRLPADDRYPIYPPELEEEYTEDGPHKVMNPARKPFEVIQDLESTMSETEAAGQLGQSPQPAGGNKIKEEWLSQRFSVYDLEQLAKKEGFVPIVWNATLDGAYTKAKTNSATGVLVWAIYRGKLYLRDYRNWWLEFPDLVSKLPAFLLASGFTRSSTIYVEPKGPGKSLVQTLRQQTNLNIIEDPLPPGTTQMDGKEARVDRSTPFLRGMNAFLASGPDWGVFASQCTMFPNAAHTDLVDTLTMAVEKVDMVIDLSDSKLWG